MPSNEPITALAELLAVNTAANDLIPIVDVSAGVTKRQEIDQTMRKIQSLMASYVVPISEEPAGDKDQVNLLFVLSESPTSGSLILKLNGLVLTDGDDYTYTGPNVIMDYALYTDDTLIASYNYIVD